jgi:hypothetical protein
MKRLTTHSKLLGLGWLVLIFGASLVVLAGCGGLLPDQQVQSASPFQSYDQVVESFNQIVPGMTNAQDLPNLGFDPRTANVDVLSYVDIETRFLQAPGLRWDHLDPAVQACIRAEAYCNGYVFHPSHSSNKRLGAVVPDLLGFERITRSVRRSADVTLLVMNGRVVHKVFSGTTRSENVDDRKQPLGPVQDLGGVIAHAVGSVPSY